MVFKSFVDAIIKYQRNPDDILALNTVNTLKRELRNDLIQAYDVSEPLIRKHTGIFFESNSFLDFLIKIHQLPECQIEDSLLKQQLEQCQKEKNSLQRQIEEYLRNRCFNTERTNCEKNLENCIKEKESLRKLLEECQKQNNLIQEKYTHLLSIPNSGIESSTQLQQFKFQYENITAQLNGQINTLKEQLCMCQQENETQKLYYEREIGNLKEEFSKYRSKHRILKNIRCDKELSQSITNMVNNRPDDSDDESNMSLNVLYEHPESPQQLSLLNVDSPEILKKENQTLQDEIKNLSQQLKEANDRNQKLEETLQLINESLNTTKTSLELKNKVAEEYKERYSNCLERLKNSNAENNVISYLKQQYNSEEWEDLFIAEWERDKLLLKKAYEQCKKIETEGDCINVTLENFGDQILGLLSNLTKDSTISEIAKIVSFNNTTEEDLIPHIKVIMDELNGYKNVIVRLGFNEVTFSEEILKIWNTLKIYALRLVPNLAIDNKNWISLFLTRFENYTNDFQQLKEAAFLHNPDLKTKSEWLQQFLYLYGSLVKKAESLENILLEFSKLTPDIAFENKITWKNDFIKRYKGLWKFALNFTDSDEFLTLIPEKNLTIDDCIDPFVSSLESFEMNLQEIANYLTCDNESKWMKKCIEKMIEVIKSSNLQDDLIHIDLPEDIEMDAKIQEELPPQSTSTKQNLSLRTLHETKISLKQSGKLKLTRKSLTELYTQCLKLAKYFQINKELETCSFFNDIMSSPLLKNYNEMEKSNKQWPPFFSNLKLYFNIQNISSESIVNSIETTFQMVLNEMNVSPLNLKTEEKSTFQTHLYVYSKWIIDQFSFKCETQSRNILSLYNKWLLQLHFDPNLAPENFLEHLIEYMRKQRKSKPFDFECSESSAKKLALDENWSNIEIQNLIYALYKSFFTLKFNILQRNNSILKDNDNHVQEKLKIIEHIKQNMRQNGLLNACTNYVKFDLKIFTENNLDKIFTDVHPKDELLEKCMRETEKTLSALISAAKM